MDRDMPFAVERIDNGDIVLMVDGGEQEAWIQPIIMDIEQAEALRDMLIAVLS